MINSALSGVMAIAVPMPNPQGGRHWLRRKYPQPLNLMVMTTFAMNMAVCYFFFRGIAYVDDFDIKIEC